MRKYALWICVTLYAIEALAASPKTSIRPQLTLEVFGNNFEYSITHPDLVQSAWLEVRDEPRLLDRRRVEVQSHAELEWLWNRTSLIENEWDDDDLTLSLWDPNGETIVCDGVEMSSQSGGRVARTLIGNREHFDPETYVQQGFDLIDRNSDEAVIEVHGSNFNAATKFYVGIEKTGDCNERLMHWQVLDMTRARVTLSAECLRTPGMLYLTTTKEKLSEWDSNKAWIQIAGLKSPDIKRVSPSRISADALENQLSFVVFGSGFTPKSEVFIGDVPGTIAGSYQPQVEMDTEFVSPTELRVRSNPDSTSSYPVSEERLLTAGRLRFWVVGNEEKYELSQPFDIAIEPSTTRKAPVTARVFSVTPFPIRLMHEHNPQELRITLRGENFRPVNKVFVQIGHLTTGDKEIRSEYVSPHLMRAWLPREYWRKHKFRYTLVVETKSGERITKTVAESEE